MMTINFDLRVGFNWSRVLPDQANSVLKKFNAMGFIGQSEAKAKFYSEQNDLTKDNVP